MKVRAVVGEMDVVQFFCPGCQEIHTVHITNKNASGARWNFNGNFNKPTFTPSIHLKTGKYADPTWEEPDDKPGWSVICHSFVTDGKIKFLTDCTHSLKGQTVELPDIQ